MKKAVLLDVDHVSKSFILSKQRQSELILEAVSLQVQTHQFISIIGSSGVGKSTITNILIPEAEMETSHISYKLNRGRNTTRHVEIFDLPEGGMIYDTPGFTSFDISGISEDELMYLYPEIAEYTGNCRFDNCRHVNEPDCKVKQAVEAGKINKDRYLSYVKIYGEIKENSVRR